MNNNEKRLAKAVRACGKGTWTISFEYNSVKISIFISEAMTENNRIFTHYRFKDNYDRDMSFFWMQDIQNLYIGPNERDEELFELSDLDKMCKRILINKLTNNGLNDFWEKCCDEIEKHKEPSNLKAHLNKHKIELNRLVDKIFIKRIRKKEVGSKGMSEKQIRHLVLLGINEEYLHSDFKDHIIETTADPNECDWDLGSQLKNGSYKCSLD